MIGVWEGKYLLQNIRNQCLCRISTGLYHALPGQHRGICGMSRLAENIHKLPNDSASHPSPAYAAPAVQPAKSPIYQSVRRQYSSIHLRTIPHHLQPPEQFNSPPWEQDASCLYRTDPSFQLGIYNKGTAIQSRDGEGQEKYTRESELSLGR